MINNKIEYDTQYPWGISPMNFGLVAFPCMFGVMVVWLMSSLDGDGDFGIALLIAVIPILLLFGYEFFRLRNFSWLVTAIQNVVSSARLVKEVNPSYRTIFGYNKVQKGPIFEIEQINENRYSVTFVPNGCPNQTIDLLPLLQAELPQYTVTLNDRLPKKYIIAKHGYGKELTNADFD